MTCGTGLPAVRAGAPGIMFPALPPAGGASAMFPVLATHLHRDPPPNSRRFLTYRALAVFSRSRFWRLRTLPNTASSRIALLLSLHPCCARGAVRRSGSSVARRVREKCSRGVDRPQSWPTVGTERDQGRELTRPGASCGGMIQAHHHGEGPKARPDELVVIGRVPNPLPRIRGARRGPW